MARKFGIFKDKRGEYRFHLRATNGEVIATSEGYKTKASARTASSRCKPTRRCHGGGRRDSPTRSASRGHKSLATWVLLLASGYLIVPEFSQNERSRRDGHHAIRTRVAGGGTNT
jgi:uncharacterized protein YegP (UPF0339 family)